MVFSSLLIFGLFDFRESEARQVVELAYKTLESEFRKRETIINQFESEANDLRFSLYHEREARINQVFICWN